jgi:hypothetical protein
MAALCRDRRKRETPQAIGNRLRRILLISTDQKTRLRVGRTETVSSSPLQSERSLQNAPHQKIRQRQRSGTTARLRRMRAPKRMRS